MMSVEGMGTITRQLAKKYFTEIQSIRRHLHRNPELSFAEYNTAAFIMSKLNEHDIIYKKGFAGNGFVAEIEGKKQGKKKKRIIALRADMDALPLTEKNETDYKSEKPGIMHACGHDVHVASLLGTAFILNDLRNEFSGKLKFIFQPAEERAPGGARQMLDEGALMPDEPDIVIAQHVYPLLESGSIGLKGGIYMASSDEIYITVTGRGGHAAMPHELVDPVTVATQIIVSLQQIVSRFSPPMVPTVLSFGRFIADGSTNVIPDTVYIEGTFRTMNEDWRAEAKKRLSGIAVSVAESLGASCKILIKDGFPLLINDESTAATVRNIACEFLGNDKVHDLEIRMTSEDFSYFAQKYPAVFYRLGTANTEKGINSPLHSSSFDIDESSLETGMGLMAYICLRMLGQ